MVFGETHGLGIVGDFIEAVRGFSITSAMMIFVFVPAMAGKARLPLTDMPKLPTSYG